MICDWIGPLLGLCQDAIIAVDSLTDGNLPGTFRVQDEAEAGRRLKQAGVSYSSQELNPGWGFFRGRGETSIHVPRRLREQAREALGDLAIED